MTVRYAALVAVPTVWKPPGYAPVRAGRGTPDAHRPVL